MRKLSVILFGLLLGLNVMAEDILQVVPFSTSAGIVENNREESFSINMNNTLQYTALQFDLYLPEGMTLIEEDPFEFNSDRLPGKKVEEVWYPNHSINITNPEPGHYFVKVYNNDLETINGTEGEIFSVYYLTSESMKPGYYPIQIEGLCLAVTGRPENGARVSTSISYVKIGDPEENVVYDLGEGIVPSFVESEMTDVNNVVVNGSCQSLVLTDGYDFAASVEFTATNASYSREMNNAWGTICLPYAVSSDANVAYFQITACKNGVLTIQRYDELPAGTPALVKKLSGNQIAPASASVMVNGNIQAVSGAVTMFGTYAKETINDANAYYIKDNQFWQCNGNFNCGAFRAYFTVDSGSAKPASFVIGEDEVDAINALVGESNVTIESVYNTNGVRHSDLQNGLNIVKLSNGKTQKILVK